MGGKPDATTGKHDSSAALQHAYTDPPPAPHGARRPPRPVSVLGTCREATNPGQSDELTDKRPRCSDRQRDKLEGNDHPPTRGSAGRKRTEGGEQPDPNGHAREAVGHGRPLWLREPHSSRRPSGPNTAQRSGRPRQAPLRGRTGSASCCPARRELQLP
ncbi:Hypothetical predicted protein [Marmota monax]|uniref:Uncharacterized protein n=1 Tax=Marmota monax TaxID=9995 RepID=A0A5E4DAJ8_MARMO|nr:Hypothetical predicted protein [Marmota monax]